MSAPAWKRAASVRWTRVQPCARRDMEARALLGRETANWIWGGWSCIGSPESRCTQGICRIYRFFRSRAFRIWDRQLSLPQYSHILALLPPGSLPAAWEPRWGQVPPPGSLAAALRLLWGPGGARRCLPGRGFETRNQAGAKCRPDRRPLSAPRCTRGPL